jgi:hypothetical protein
MEQATNRSGFLLGLFNPEDIFIYFFRTFVDFYYAMWLYTPGDPEDRSHQL